jgi:hypothetical protein
MGLRPIVNGLIALALLLIVAGFLYDVLAR